MVFNHHIIDSTAVKTKETLTIDSHAGLVDESVAVDDAVGKNWLAPGDVDGGGGELAEMDETGCTGS